MRLRNKKTGEIKDVESLGHEKSLKDKYGLQITLSWDTEYENLSECRTYNSLAELNEEWEDYEEPKDYYFIRSESLTVGYSPINNTRSCRNRKQIGNYFSSREEAEKALEKLKAWKRLKDKGFDFVGCSKDNTINYEFVERPLDYDEAEEAEQDLAFLFGGEE